MFFIEVRHQGLHKYRVVKGHDQQIVEETARVQLAAWNATWERQSGKERERLEKARDQRTARDVRERVAYSIVQRKEAAAARTLEATTELKEHERILIDSLGGGSLVNWNRMKQPKLNMKFTEAPPSEPVKLAIPSEPKAIVQNFSIKLSFFDKIVPGRRRRLEDQARAREMDAQARFTSSQNAWKLKCDEIRQQTADAEIQHSRDLIWWEERRRAFFTKQEEVNTLTDASNALIDRFRERYQNGDSEAVVEYCELALSNSEYPGNFPREWSVDFESENGILVVNYRLPALSDMPTLKEAKYVASRDAIEEVKYSEKTINNLFDSVVYQIAIRTINELFSSDIAQNLKSVAFNGWVIYINPSNGTECRSENILNRLNLL